MSHDVASDRTKFHMEVDRITQQAECRFDGGGINLWSLPRGFNIETPVDMMAD